MKQRRKIWKVNVTFRFLNITLVISTLFALINFYALVKVVTETQYSLLWRVNLIIVQMCFVGIIFAFLASLMVILNRSLGLMPRIEGVLDKVIAGDYSQRLVIRKNDIIHPLVNRVNNIIELLEGTSKAHPPA
ncbi:MAG: hypothetical protein WC510_04300 [Candidatus Omnitrophota bacterium]